MLSVIYYLNIKTSFYFSGPSPAIAGGDAVDYGAYTGGYGAFGWYSDHPNHEGMAIRVVEFSNRGYKTSKIFA